MPNIKSAKKRVKVISAKTLQNQIIKSGLKTCIKNFEATVLSGDKAAAEAAFRFAVKKLDQAAATKAKPTITGIQTATQQLETALCNLTAEKVLPIPAVPDVTPLANILKYIEDNFEEDMFTAESWAALKGPLDAAKALHDAAVKHEELTAEYNTLYKAYTKARDNSIGYAEEIDKALSRYEEALRDKEKGEATDDDVANALLVLDAAKAEAEAPKAARD